jgi:hypothetical protein
MHNSGSATGGAFQGGLASPVASEEILSLARPSAWPELGHLIVPGGNPRSCTSIRARTGPIRT